MHEQATRIRSLKGDRGLDGSLWKLRTERAGSAHRAADYVLEADSFLH